MPASAAAADLDRARLRVGWLALLHFAIAFLLVPIAFLSYVNALDPTIDEYSDLSQFTPINYWSLLGAWAPVLPTTLVAFIAVRRLSSPLRHFWIVPSIGIATSIACYFATYPSLFVTSLASNS